MILIVRNHFCTKGSLLCHVLRFHQLSESSENDDSDAWVASHRKYLLKYDCTSPQILETCQYYHVTQSPILH